MSGGRRLRRAALPAALAAIGAACTGPPAPSAGPSPAPVALSVAFAGCAALRTGPICELTPNRALRVYFEGPALVTLSGATGTVIPGQGASLTVDLAATEVVITAGDAVFRLPVESPSAPDPLLTELTALRKSRQFDAASSRLEAALPTAPEALRGRLLGLRARLALARGDARGAVGAFSEALPLHHAAGRVSDEVDDALAQVYVQVHRLRDFAGARRTLDDASEAARSYPEGAAGILASRARLAVETGDLRSALAALAEAEPVFVHLGAGERLRAARQTRAEALTALGRAPEAEALLGTLRADADAAGDACGAVSYAMDLLWTRLGRLPEGPSAAGAALLSEIRTGLTDRRARCPDRTMETIALLNLALTGLRTGDTGAAAGALAEIRRTEPHPGTREVLWLLDLEARTALAAGHAGEAATAFTRLRALAEAAAAPEAAWRAAVGKARSLSASGHTSEAATAYVEAEGLLSQEGLLVPLEEGRETFFGEREAGTREAVSLLVGTGRPADAAQALSSVRRARARALQAVRRADRLPTLSPEERARWESAIATYRTARAVLDGESAGDWELSAEKLEAARRDRAEREVALRRALDAALEVLTETGPGGAVGDAAPLPIPAPDELLLAWFPGANGWVAFAAKAGGSGESLSVRAVPMAGIDRPFAPFPGEIATAKRLRLLPYGPLNTRDLHAEPVDGAPLIVRHPVVYGLDLSPLPPSPPEAAALGGVLLVADPRGDLPGARIEGDAVEAIRRPTGEPIVRLQGEAATGPAVRAALGTASLLHWAGHGRFAGAGGWQSVLPLAGDSRLTIGDILALPRVPPLVVLSGCETARQADTAALEGVGLAQAFLVAGASAAIAATRPVQDAFAKTLSAALHQALVAGQTPDEALRSVQRSLAAQPAPPDWAAFRVLVR